MEFADPLDISNLRYVGRYGIRDLDAGGIFDHGLWLFRDNIRQVLILCVLVAIPLEFAMGAADELLIPTESVAEPVDDFPWREFFLGIGLMVIHASVVFPFIICPLTVLFLQSYLGHSPSIAYALKTGIRSLLRVSVVIVVGQFSFLIGLVLCVIPGIIANVAFAVASEAVVVERCGALTALERSVRLTMRSFFPVFFVSFAITLLVNGVTGLAESIPFPWTRVAVSSCLSSLVYCFTVPIWLATYFALRCRHEAYDLEVMAALVDTDSGSRGGNL